MDDDNGSALIEKGYDKGKKLGEGTYGVVFSGRNLATGPPFPFLFLFCEPARREPLTLANEFPFSPQFIFILYYFLLLSFVLLFFPVQKEGSAAVSVSNP